MKKNTHPPYQEVLFVDSSTGASFVIGSTLQPKEKGKFEGKEYPMSRVPISSSSHPFFTKTNQLLDSEGRVDKFKKKYERNTQAVKASQEKQEEKQREAKQAAAPKKKK